MTPSSTPALWPGSGRSRSPPSARPQEACAQLESGLTRARDEGLLYEEALLLLTRGSSRPRRARPIAEEAVKMA